MQVRGRWYLVGLLVVAVAARGPRPAYAEGERTATLRRAVSNVLLGPLDVALSPVVTVQALGVNARAAGYPWPATAALELLGGGGWFLPLTAVTGVFRMWSGFAEMPVGVAVLVSKSFTDWEPAPFFEVREEPALVSCPNPVIPLKFGVNYFGGSAR